MRRRRRRDEESKTSQIKEGWGGLIQDQTRLDGPEETSRETCLNAVRLSEERESFNGRR